jgi:hypothetical protein
MTSNKKLFRLNRIRAVLSINNSTIESDTKKVTVVRNGPWDDFFDSPGVDFLNREQDQVQKTPPGSIRRQ